MKAKRKVPNIVRGGRAIPVGKDLYLLQGRTHEQGGIDIGKNPRTGIEAEGGEIVQMKPNELRVHSAQPLLNGESPAEKILKGANPDKVFQAQEQFKDRHRINDDGTKYDIGGKTDNADNVTYNGGVLPEVNITGSAWKHRQAVKRNKGKQVSANVRESNNALGNLISDNSPVVGDVKEVVDLGKDLVEGNYLNAAVGSLLLAIPSNVGKYAKKTIANGIRKGAGKLYKKFNSIKFKDDVVSQFYKQDVLPRIKQYQNRDIKLDDKDLTFNYSLQPNGPKGSYNHVTDRANINILGKREARYNPFDVTKNSRDTKVHEIGHRVQYKHNNNRDYNARFDNNGELTNNPYYQTTSEYADKTLEHAYPTKDGDVRFNENSNKNYERETTNRQLRFNIWDNLRRKNKRTPTIKETDEAINALSDEDLLNTVGNINGYGQDYSNFIKDNKRIFFKGSPADNIKKALITVGAIAPVMMNNEEKRNGGMIEINGNVKNGLIHTPRSTKKCGGRKKARLGTDEDNTWNLLKNRGLQQIALQDSVDRGLIDFDTEGVNANETITLPEVTTTAKRNLNELDEVVITAPRLSKPDNTYAGRDNRKLGNRRQSESKPKYKFTPKTPWKDFANNVIDFNNKLHGRTKSTKNNTTEEVQIAANNSGINIKDQNVPRGYYGYNTPNTQEGINVKNQSVPRGNHGVSNNNSSKGIIIKDQSVPRGTYNNVATSAISTTSSTGSQAQSNSTSTSSTISRGSGTNTDTSSNTRGRKTITDAKVSKSWRETVGDDADVLNYIANGDAWEHKNWQDRHSKIIKDSGYDPKSGRAVRNDEVKQYYKDFNDKFHTANRKLALYTTPAGKSGDNQFGEKKRFGGRRKAVTGTSDPYADEYVGNQGWNRKLGPGDRESLQYLQGQIDSRRQSPLRRAAFQRGDGYAGVIDQMATPEFKGLNVAKPNIEDLRPTIKQDVVKANKAAERKRLTARDRFSDGPTTGDWIGAGANLAGSIGDFIGTNAYLNKMKAPGVRVEAPVKLKTKFNINPQLDATKQAREQAFRDIDANTASSATGLARKQNVRNNTLMATNQLWGNKENTETQLINQDKMNLQGVRNRNTTRLNRWEEQKASINNAKYNAKAANLGNMLGNISGTVNDVIGRVEMRKRDNNTLAAIKAATGNVDDRIFTDAGVNYDPRNRKYINTNKGVAATARYGKRKKLK